MKQAYKISMFCGGELDRIIMKERETISTMSNEIIYIEEDT